MNKQRVDIIHIKRYNLCNIAGWSSLVARRAHNPKVVGSNPSPATQAFRFRKAFSFLLNIIPFKSDTCAIFKSTIKSKYPSE